MCSEGRSTKSYRERTERSVAKITGGLNQYLYNFNTGATYLLTGSDIEYGVCVCVCVCVCVSVCVCVWLREAGGGGL